MQVANSEESAVLPTVTCGHYFIAETFINGQGPFAMLLDTGAPKTILSKEAAKELGIKSKIKKMAIGDLELTGKIKCSVKEIDHLDDALGINIDGILGHSVFKKVLLTYDYPAKELRVRVGALDKSLPGIAPMSKSSRPFLGAMLGDTKINVLLDTGSSSGLTLSKFESLSFQNDPRPIGARMRINGLYTVKAGRLQDDVRFGSFLLAQPIVNDAVGVSLLGQKILKNYVLTIDQQNGLVQIVRPDATQAQEPIVSPSLFGLGMAVLAEDQSLIVHKVFKGTSAKAAGFLRGDILLEIDGVPFSERRCVSRDATDHEPVRRTYLIERNGERFEIQVTTAILVD